MVNEDPRVIEGDRRHCHGCKAEIFWAEEHICPVLTALEKKLEMSLLEIKEFNKKDKAFEDATVQNLEALQELLEVLTPFYLHAKALRNADVLNLAPLKEISKCGVSALVGGAFSSVIEVFEKWGPVAGVLERPLSEYRPAVCCCHLVASGHGGYCPLHADAKSRLM